MNDMIPGPSNIDGKERDGSNTMPTPPPSTKKRRISDPDPDEDYEGARNAKRFYNTLMQNKAIGRLLTRLQVEVEEQNAHIEHLRHMYLVQAWPTSGADVEIVFQNLYYPYMDDGKEAKDALRTALEYVRARAETLCEHLNDEDSDEEEEEEEDAEETAQEDVKETAQEGDEETVAEGTAGATVGETAEEGVEKTAAEEDAEEAAEDDAEEVHDTKADDDGDETETDDEL